jgi:hypothetical protein
MKTLQKEPNTLIHNVYITTYKCELKSQLPVYMDNTNNIAEESYKIFFHTFVKYIHPVCLLIEYTAIEAMYIQEPFSNL